MNPVPLAGAAAVNPSKDCDKVDNLFKIDIPRVTKTEAGSVSDELNAYTRTPEKDFRNLWTMESLQAL